MPKFAVHMITGKIKGSENAYNFWFLAPSGTYKGDIGPVCGVAEITEANNLGNFAPLCSVEELLKSSIAVRRKLRVKANGKRKYKTVIVSADKQNDFEVDAVGKSAGDGTVEAVIEPLKASYR